MSLSEAPRTSDVGERPEEVEEEEEKEEGEAEEAEELSALERFHAKLQEHGVDIEPVDLPRAIVIHEVLGLSFFVGTLGACYALQPTQRLASSRWAQRVKAELARRAEPSSQAQGTATAAAAAAADRRGSWFSARWTKAKSFLSRFMSPRMVVALVSSFSCWLGRI